MTENKSIFWLVKIIVHRSYLSEIFYYFFIFVLTLENMQKTWLFWSIFALKYTLNGLSKFSSCAVKDDYLSFKILVVARRGTLLE
jgi:hypothetical protein